MVIGAFIITTYSLYLHKKKKKILGLFFVIVDD